MELPWREAPALASSRQLSVRDLRPDDHGVGARVVVVRRGSEGGLRRRGAFARHHQVSPPHRHDDNEQQRGE